LRRHLRQRRNNINGIVNNGVPIAKSLFELVVRRFTALEVANIKMKAFILLAIFIIFSGCSEQPVNTVSQAPVSRSAKEVKQGASGAVKMADTGVVEDGQTAYNYKPSGRRDPFRSLILGLKEKKVAGLTPLQLRSLGELKVIGIMWEGKSFVAMIETPDGKGYLVREGVLVGPEGGVVRKISAEAVTIEEIFTDFNGRKKAKMTVLGLRSKEEAVDEDN